MKTIISQCLAMPFIGASFLACASPIVLNPNLVQRNSLASANSISNNVRGISSIPELSVNVELSNSNGLTRRDGRASPVPNTINPLTRTDPYDTPLAFWNFLRAHYSVVLQRRIFVWESIVQELEAKVDSLEPFGFPTWLVKECWEEIDSEGHRIQWFLSKEPENGPRYTLIKKHETDIDRVKRKLSEHAPRLGVRVPPPTPDVEEKESSVVGQEPSNQIYGVHGRPSRSHSRSAATKLELHTKARRTRIEQWHRDEVRPLEQQLQRLPESGFLHWLVSDCTYQISHELDLIALFGQEERIHRDALATEEHDNKYFNILDTHKAALYEVRESLENMRAEFRSSHLPHVLPRMRDGGDWRLVVKRFVEEVKRIQAYDRQEDNQIDAGLEVYDAMALATPNLNDQSRQLISWRTFLDKQEEEVNEAKQEFHAGQREHSPTVTDRR